MLIHCRDIIFILVICSYASGEDDVCYVKNECDERKDTTRYLLYDVNPAEGFNLRRDVYVRFAVLAHKLHHSKNAKLNTFKLVLPPWSYLRHWGYSKTPQHIPWSLYFDVKSLQKFAPVIEMHEFFSSVNTDDTVIKLDEVIILQHFKDMFESGNFEDRWKIEECHKRYYLTYLHYSNITTNNVKCVSYHGPATKLTDLLLKTNSRSVLLDHAEIALHDIFGGKTYWEARRSMRFNSELREIAKEFRKKYLNSQDDTDRTELPLDWRNEKPKRNAIGGPYVAVHMRRMDFLTGRPQDVPSIDAVARQIGETLEKLKINKVFIATDAPYEEYDELKSKLIGKYEVFKYEATKQIKAKFNAGGIAIIDQIICSYSRYFLGTSESTFSFRIQEEREILGFPTQTTFNTLCKTKETCKKPSIWKIVY